MKLVEHLCQNDERRVELTQVRHEHVNQWEWQQNNDQQNVNYIHGVYLQAHRLNNITASHSPMLLFQNKKPSCC